MMAAKGGLLANNNLTSAAYRQLDGPPLAPPPAVLAGDHERGHRALSGRGPARSLSYVELAWGEVVSPSGFHFLPVHFNGKPLGRDGPCIRRDLRGVRPDDLEKMPASLRRWCALTIRGKAFLEGLGAA